MGILEARSRIGVLRRYVYLDNASAGPLPDSVVEASREFLDSWFNRGEPWDQGLMAVIECKRLFAGLVNASMDEIAAFPGVTYGLAVILSSLKLSNSSNIVVSPHNFPTNIVMAKAMAASGLVREVRVAKPDGSNTVDIEVYERLIDDSTSIVMVDYVGWLSGYVEDIREVARIAHEHGAIVVTDAFHAVGVMPVDVRRLDVDILITGSYKWLMSTHGAALAYIRRDILDDMIPRYAGWLALEDSVVKRMLRGEPEFEKPLDVDILKFAGDSSKLEWGTLPLLAFIALREALKFIISFRAPELYEIHTWRLADRLAEELENLGFKLYTPRERHGAIVSVEHRRPLELVAELERRGVKVAARPGLIRVSPHFYNTMEDVERLIEILRELKARYQLS
ncbi:MAG: aminotransferase class V-fold PLP-dependent enzyme [Thermoproteota archaeon]